LFKCLERERDAERMKLVQGRIKKWCRIEQKKGEEDQKILKAKQERDRRWNR